MVANARTIRPSEDPDVLTIEGDITDPETADRIIGGALGRFGRIDMLVNNAGVCTPMPFTDYAAADYAWVIWPGWSFRLDGVSRGRHVPDRDADPEGSPRRQPDGL